MKLEDIRDQIDQLDSEIAKLLEARFAIVNEVAEFKKANNYPINDQTREKEIITRLKEQEYTKEVIEVFQKIFEISKAKQINLNK
ncbi:MAG: chorismate mutase [Mycoplasmatales bacterium]